MVALREVLRREEARQAVLPLVRPQGVLLRALLAPDLLLVRRLDCLPGTLVPVLRRREVQRVRLVEALRLEVRRVLLHEVRPQGVLLRVVVQLLLRRLHALRRRPRAHRNRRLLLRVLRRLPNLGV